MIILLRLSCYALAGSIGLVVPLTVVYVSLSVAQWHTRVVPPDPRGYNTR